MVTYRDNEINVYRENKIHTGRRPNLLNRAEVTDLEDAMFSIEKRMSLVD